MENLLSYLTLLGKHLSATPSSSCHGALPLLLFPSAVPLLWCKCPSLVTLVISDFYRIHHPNSILPCLSFPDFPRTMYWFYTLSSQPLHSERSFLKWNSFGFWLFFNIQYITKPVKDTVWMMIVCLRKNKSFTVTQQYISGIQKHPLKKKKVTKLGKYYSTHLCAFLLQNVLQGTANLTKRREH